MHTVTENTFKNFLKSEEFDGIEDNDTRTTVPITFKYNFKNLEYLLLYFT